MRAPAVFLMLLLLCGCKDRTDDDFTRALAQYVPDHVAGADSRVR
jgi:hypothetical protein